MIYYIKEADTDTVVVRWDNLEKAISSMRYLATTHRKRYEVLAVVYTTEAADSKDYDEFIMEQMNKYGCD